MAEFDGGYNEEAGGWWRQEEVHFLTDTFSKLTELHDKFGNDLIVKEEFDDRQTRINIIVLIPPYSAGLINFLLF